MNLLKYKEFLSSKRAARNFLVERKEELQSKVDGLNSYIIDLGEAQEVMNIVGILSQEEVKQVVESLVTQALQYVFGETYSFEMESRILRNQPEMYLHVLENGELTSLKEDQAGGVIDLVSFVLRVVFWAIQVPRTRNTMIFDEPLKNLDSDRLVLLGDMIRFLSEKLNLQFIIVTHEEELAVIGDVSYHVTRKDGISQVEKMIDQVRGMIDSVKNDS